MYAQPRFSPTVTQEMRLRAPLQQNTAGPGEVQWVTQTLQRRPELVNPSSEADIVRIALSIILSVVLGGLLLVGLALFALLADAGPAIILLASLPLTVIVVMVWWFDRWKPQPVWLLISCLLWGAVASVFLTLFTQTLGIVAFSTIGVNLTGDIVGAVVLAPIFEESTKGIFLVVIVLAARKYFEGPLDGWVYGSLIGAGFAFTENLLYLNAAYGEGAVEGLLFTFLLRCVLSPLLHSTFVICAGMSIGLAARRGSWWLAALMWIPGLIGGMFLHALWNGMASIRFSSDISSFAVTIVLAMIISAFWLTSGLILRRNESIHTRQALGDYANAGWLTHGEVDMLGTWKGRREAKRWASQYPGAVPFMKKLIRTAADLATIRTRVLAGVGGARERKIEKYELEQFTALRKKMMRAVQNPHQQHPGQFGQPGQYGHSGQQGQYGQPAQPGQYGQPNHYGQPGHPGQPANPGQLGHPGRFGPGHGSGSAGPAPGQQQAP